MASTMPWNEVGGPQPASEENSMTVDLDIPLEYNEDAASQLGGTIFKNKTETNLSSPRNIITEKEIRNFRFQARYHYRMQNCKRCLAHFSREFSHTPSRIVKNRQKSPTIAHHTVLQ